MTTPRKPSTRGFLFADLRGYSAFVEGHGDTAARELLRRYRALVRQQIAAFDGAEIRTEGDSFYVVFESVADAVMAGLAIRDAAEAPEPGVDPIRVGIGIHAGEVTDGEDGIVSSAVNIAARVCAVAGPGEVLVTDTVRALIRTATDVAFTPRGRRRLKGISDPVALFAAGDRASRPSARRVRPVAIAVAGVAAIALVVGAGAALVQRDMSGVGAASPTPTSTAPPVAPESSESSASLPTSDPFPNADESELLDRLPNQVADRCERADADDRPVYEDTALVAGATVREVPLRISAGLTCLTDLTRVVYWRAISPSEIDAIFIQRISKGGAAEGDCSLGSRAWQTWEVGPHAGKLYCYTNSDGEAVLEWTFGYEPVYASASRRDGDTAALYAWWRDVGRLMSR